MVIYGSKYDSHARDIYGRAHSQGTCVLFETSSLDSLVYYSLWQGWLSGESTCLPPMWPGVRFLHSMSYVD